MTVSYGSALTSANLNDNFASKTSDNTLTGVLDLNDSASGSRITNVQQEINSLKTDISSGSTDVHVIASNSDASTYNGSAKIIKITSSEDVTFTSALADRIIIVETNVLVTFQADLDNCDINHQGNLKFENTSTDGSITVDARNCRIRCNTLTLDNSGNTSGNLVRLDHCNVHCSTFTPVDRANERYLINESVIFCDGNFDGGDSSNDLDLYRSKVTCNTVTGYIDLLSTGDSGSILEVLDGATSGSATIKIAGTTYLNGVYAYPFKVDMTGIKTLVAVLAKVSPSQAVSTTDPEKIDFDKVVDNTSAFTDSLSRFTAKVKGYYRVNLNVLVTGYTVGETLELRIQKSGSTGNDFYLPVQASSVNGQTTFAVANFSHLVSLDVGDYVECFVNSIVDASYSVSTNTKLDIHKMN